MKYKIIVSPIASKNIEDAVEYYIFKVSKKVASDFLKDYKKTYKALETNPFYKFHDTNYRFFPFEKFPYIAFFMVDEPSKTVFLNAVFHTSQDPDKYPQDTK
jgi:toxin ParE1/3/4